MVLKHDCSCHTSRGFAPSTALRCGTYNETPSSHCRKGIEFPVPTFCHVARSKLQ